MPSHTIRRDSDVQLQLHWENKDGTVTVTPDDGDRFVIKVRRAIEALQHLDKVGEFQAQFNLLLRRLAEWLNNRDDIQAAHVTLRDGSLAFVVVRNAAEYNAEFEDELSELDYSIANDVDLDLITLNVIALPSVSCEAAYSFLDPNFVLTYSDGGRS